ncbi:GNAT family N-acetyltransferase [Flavilitoribacter nigricans]|uniref:N-acetyltransferase domain-containing protein n=1 Tax=Flavilitoribacter nigricans (strain ATCC 23147 / DSM 23189 / NBRC 102662 / NCIMB 1420 / SS-2) TaxID=1122177 RepID=A0A2D0N531_FLAN2|nr:GNAT family protein [Flavilitoribacter nigricans]PHN03621.1 hypothetical protein CRP01_25520 [Flavilitoribacter nigricans DSM 23189 = NBRC 102662]
MFPIKTPRLRLIPLNAAMLKALGNGRDQLEEILGLQPSGLQISSGMEEEIAEALEFWQNFTREHPEDFYWGTNWEIVLDEENRTIGGIGMGGPPNSHGQVTVGYHIDVREHRQGFGTEALAGLRDWALQQDGCTSMVAFTPVDNLPSQKVLTNCGFELVEQVEEAGMDCYFWRYEASATG